MLTDADAVDLALSVPLLASLDAASVKRVRAEATVQRCRPGDALLREGTVSAEIVVLVAGEAVVHRGGRAVDLITAPSVVGLLAAVDKGPRTADVLALDDAVAVHLPAPLVERLRAKSPAFGDALVRQLAGDVRGLYQSPLRDAPVVRRLVPLAERPFDPRPLPVRAVPGGVRVDGARSRGGGVVAA
jgi:CRP/FNR family cyclic AMP-dependent transcriptional regulator